MSAFGERQGRDMVLLVIAVAVLGWWIIRAAGQLVHGYPASDFRNYWLAAQDVSAGRDPYTATLRCCHGVVRNDGFNYPPLVAELVRPLSGLPLGVANRVWLGVNELMLGAAIFVTWRTLRGRVGGPVLLALFSLTLAFRPVVVAMDQGQVGVLMVFLLALAASSYARQRQAGWAGVAVAAATLVKPLPVLLAIGFVRWDRRPRLLAAAATFTAAGVAIVLSLWLLTPYTAEFFVRVLPGFTTGSPEIYGNQSLPAVSQRAQLVLLGGVTTPGRILTAIAVLGLIGLTWWRGSRVEGHVGRLAVFASLLAVIPLASTLTWDHHLITEMLALALLTPSLAQAPRLRRVLVAAYLLLWLPAFPWLVVFSALHAPYVVSALVAGSMPTLGELLLWLACLASLPRG
ncbi:MAG: glycosyltransferase family 87 protein [Candidatus Dormibacteria bacterium]